MLFVDMPGARVGATHTIRLLQRFRWAGRPDAAPDVVSFGAAARNPRSWQSPIPRHDIAAQPNGDRAGLVWCGISATVPQCRAAAKPASGSELLGTRGIAGSLEAEEWARSLLPAAGIAGKTPLVTEPAKPTSDHSGRSNYLDVRICRIAIRTVNQVRVSGEFHA